MGANKLVSNLRWSDRCKSTDDHLVVRVMPDTKKYYVITMNDENEINEVKGLIAPYKTKVK